MGYGLYTLPDGRKAGYGVEAECDGANCTKQIDRGLGYLCGQNPDGWRDADEPGCGKYFCDEHLHAHDCPKQDCGKHAADGNATCDLLVGHNGPHKDIHNDTEFTVTEDDEE